MRIVIGLLVLANLALAGLIATGTVPLPAPPPRPADIAPGRLILAGEPVPERTAPAPAAEMVCLSWRGLDAAGQAAVRERLKAEVVRQGIAFSEHPEETRSWVILPPEPDVRAAMARRDALAAQGVKEAFVIREGAQANGISLGLYANATLARARIAELEAMGVTGATVVEVPRQGSGVYFIIRSTDADALKALGTLARPWPASRLARVVCPS